MTAVSSDPNGSETDRRGTVSPAGLKVCRHGDHVVEVVLDRPDALNAVSTRLAVELTETLRGLADDPTVRAVVLSSSNDRAFCVGADLKERAKFTEDDLLRQRPVIRALFGAVVGLPIPAVAAVQGYALGGGFELALSCDVIIADPSAVLGLTEVTVGLVPGGGGTQLLARRIGVGAAADLILTGRKVAAEEAYRLGVINRLVEPGRARDVAVELATAAANNSPIAVRNAKRAIRTGFGLPLAAGLEIEDAAWRAAAVSADRVEGIAAFAEKRSPRWSGT